MTEKTVEEMIQAQNLDAPRVTPAQIDALMKRVTYVTVQQPEGTTSTFVHAYLDGKFYLASGFSGCVDPSSFRANIGETVAFRKADAAARDKLWELQGYILYMLTQQPEQPVLTDAVSA